MYTVEFLGDSADEEEEIVEYYNQDGDDLHGAEEMDEMRPG